MTDDGPVPEPAWAGPCLEHYRELGGPPERVPLRKLPFTLGRSPANDRAIYSSAVSKEHAAIVSEADGYAVHDLRSTNGTFVNGQRVEAQRLCDGDIIQLGHVEFCFRIAVDPATSPNPQPFVDLTQALAVGLPESLIRGRRLLREMIATEAVRAVFQPIVDLRTREVMGYEALGRGTHPELTSAPTDLLDLADQCQLGIELSQLFRRVALASANRLPDAVGLFLNVHARELRRPGFLESLAALPPPARAQQYVLEITESSVTDVAAMAQLKSGFDRLGFKFAYDDFGAGQARLLELTDMPPHYLKLDIGLVQGIESAKPRQEVVRALSTVVSTLGVSIIAEGVETERVAGICSDLGCQFGQGYLFGRPE